MMRKFTNLLQKKRIRDLFYELKSQKSSWCAGAEKHGNWRNIPISSLKIENLVGIFKIYPVQHNAD